MRKSIAQPKPEPTPEIIYEISLSRPQIAECADGAWNIIKLSNDDANQFGIEAIDWKQLTFSADIFSSMLNTV